MRLDLAASFYGGRGFSLYHAFGSQSRVPLSPHFHDEYLISAQLRGREHCHVAGKLHQFSAGDVVLINPQQVHTGNTEGEDIEYLSLYIDRRLVNELAEELRAPTTAPEFTAIKASDQPALVQELVGLLELLRSRDQAVLYPLSSSPSEGDVDILSRRLGLATHPARDTVTELEIQTALHRVLTHAFEELSNLRHPRLRSTNRIPHRKIARAVEYLRSLGAGDRQAAELDLDDLAAVAGLSKYHFLRQFNQVVGMTPGAYLRTLRLCHAGRLLRTTDLPILDIALSVGFADHPSFSRAFARHMGMTPSEYRKLGPL